ncbi:NAD-dependent epimerase/dehydratase family protein [Bosea thiooxidans]
MKTAVFGCNGYLGQHLVHYLTLGKKNEVTGFDLSESYQGKDEIAYLSLDVTDTGSFDRLTEDFGSIYYMTGLTGTDISFGRFEKFINVNEMGLLRLLQRVRNFPRPPKIIFPSTRLVYKGIEGLALPEESEKEFKTIYALSKFNGEQYLAMHRNLFGVDYTIFRVCVPYANLVASEQSYGTVGFFLEKARNGDDISLFGDGNLRRTFTHVWDICRQMVEVASMPASNGGVYNIDGENLSLKEVASVIAAKYEVGLRFQPWPETALRLESGDTVFDASRIRALFPDTLTRTLEKWLTV